MSEPKRVKLGRGGPDDDEPYVREYLAHQLRELKAKYESLQASKADLSSAFDRCRSLDSHLKGETAADRSTFRATCGLPYHLLHSLCNPAPDDVHEAERATWEEDVFLVLHHLRTGLSFHRMRSEYMLSEKKLGRRYARTLDRLGKKLSPRFRENAMSDLTPEDLLRHTTPTWKADFPQYQYVVAVDVTLVQTNKSENAFVNQISYSHEEHAHCLAVIRVTALDGYVLYAGQFYGGAEPKDLNFANLDEKLWVQENLTKILVGWATKHSVKLWVAGDPAYGAFQAETLDPSAPVKFLVACEEEKPHKAHPSGVYKGVAQPHIPFPQGNTAEHPSTEPLNEGVANISEGEPKNHLHLPKAAFRHARQNIQLKFSKFKSWHRFAGKLRAMTLFHLDNEIVLISACENLLLEDRLAHPAHPVPVNGPQVSQVNQGNGNQPQLTEHQVTEHQVTEHQVTEHQVTEHQVTEPQANQVNATEPKSTSSKSTDK